MGRLLPAGFGRAAPADAGPRVIGLEGDDADDLLAAMSSSTARELLAALHDEPAAPSELAEHVGTSLQNVQYHLGKLEAAGAVTVVDRVYSEKGREMKLYGPADRPLVVVAGDADETASLRTALATLLSGLAVVGLLAVLVQYLVPDPARSSDDMMVMTAEATADGAQAGGLADVLVEPGIVFFLGGAAMLLVAAAVWYVRR